MRGATELTRVGLSDLVVRRPMTSRLRIAGRARPPRGRAGERDAALQGHDHRGWRRGQETWWCVLGPIAAFFRVVLGYRGLLDFDFECQRSEGSFALQRLFWELVRLVHLLLAPNPRYFCVPLFRPLGLWLLKVKGHGKGHDDRGWRQGQGTCWWVFGPIAAFFRVVLGYRGLLDFDLEGQRSEEGLTLHRLCWELMRLMYYF